MNWSKVAITGVVGGIALWLYSFVMHGLIMGKSYAAMEIFRQDGSPLNFLFVQLCMALAAAALFAKTRNAWGNGMKGGLVFGFFLGLVFFFAQFMNPLVFAKFPYYLSWCWGGIELIGWMVFGCVAAMLYKQSE